MANQEPLPSSQGSTEEQVPHSGVHHGEIPINEFGKTPLDQVPLDYDPRTTKGELHTGHLPEGFHPQPTAPERKKISRRAAMAIGGGTLAVVAAIGAVVGISHGDNSTEPKAEPSASAPAAPGESIAPSESETNVEGLLIPALENDVVNNVEYVNVMNDRSELTSPETIATTFTSYLTEVINTVAQEGKGLEDLRPLVKERLHYLIQSDSAPGLSELESFVVSSARSVQEAQEKYSQEKPGDNLPVKFGIWTTPVSSNADPSGALEVTVEDEYQINNSDMDTLSVIAANGKTQVYSFTEATVELPNQELRKTYVLSGFDFSY